MKKGLLYLFLLLLAACTDSEEGPMIRIEKIYLGADWQEHPDNYANRLEELPPLKVGDELRAFLLLDGNGAELKSFRLQNDREIQTKLHYNQTYVTTESNLTDVANGQLRFKDGVSQARVMVHAVVTQLDDEDAKLSFFLSSKANCEGAQEEIELPMEEL